MAGYYRPPILVSRIKFDKYDTDGSGYIELDELKAVLYDMGMRTTETDILGALLALDKAKDGRVSYQEFQDWYRERAKRVDALTLTDDSQRVLTQAITFFKYYDQDMSGEIDRQEFRPMYDRLKKEWQAVGNEVGTLDEVLLSFDRNGDEKISLEEFVQWLIDARSVYVQTVAN